jgi:hypothetical protein
MRDRFSGSMVTVAIAAAAASAAVSMPTTETSAQAPAVSGTALTTPWGEPDLQGIWTDTFDTPFQRPPKYANQEFFTPAQRAELDKERTALYGEESLRSAAPSSTSPVRTTTRYSCPISTSGRARR